MSTPSQQQARNHHAQQAIIATAAARAIAHDFQLRRSWPVILRRFAAYQLRAAEAAAAAVAAMAGDRTPVTQPRAFAGVSAYGFSIAEPLVATIDYRVPAPVAEPIPDPWWEDQIAAFLPAVERLVQNEIHDAGRSASQVEFVARPDWQNYVRLLTPPSCKRCALLAGRIYRDLDAFDRHGDGSCDCEMVPVQDWESAHDRGLVSSFSELFERGQVTGLSEADARAISEGADPSQVINATAGTSQPGITNALTTELHGRRVKATTYGTTKRSAWRKANPSRLVRLRPEAIYRIVDEQYDGDREQARRLLTLYGYIKP